MAILKLLMPKPRIELGQAALQAGALPIKLLRPRISRLELLLCVLKTQALPIKLYSLIEDHYIKINNIIIKYIYYCIFILF